MFPAICKLGSALGQELGSALGQEYGHEVQMASLKRRVNRAQEIAGLKEALSILENEAAFLQRGRKTGKSRSTRFMASL